MALGQQSLEEILVMKALVASLPGHHPDTLLDRFCFFSQKITFPMRLTGFPGIVLSERQAVARVVQNATDRA